MPAAARSSRAWREVRSSATEEPRIRVIGIDGRAAKPILAAFDELCATRWIEPAACRRHKIQFETRAAGHGWFYGHHNHLHVAWSASDR